MNDRSAEYGSGWNIQDRIRVVTKKNVYILVCAVIVVACVKEPYDLPVIAVVVVVVMMISKKERRKSEREE